MTPNPQEATMEDAGAEFRVRLITARELEVGDQVWAEERGFMKVKKVRLLPLIGERSGDVDVWIDDSEFPWMLADGTCPLLIRTPTPTTEERR